jgi:hypothetical protein
MGAAVVGPGERDNRGTVMSVAPWSRGVQIAAVFAGLILCRPPVEAASPFTVVVIPDIQNETQYAPAMLQSQVDWIAGHQVGQNIVCAVQLGDLTNNGNAAEYSTAHEKLFQLNNAGGLVWGTCAGNHDIDNGGDVGTKGANYDAYFGPANFHQSWYGTTASGHSSYTKFQAGERQYLMLNLEYDAPGSVLNWAQGVINANPGMATIINTHEYLNIYGGYSPYGATLWNGLVNNNSQVFMVLCGHCFEMGPQYATRTDAVGKTVYELMTDYQGVNYGDGYLRLLQFDEDNSVIRATAYSPYEDAYHSGYTYDSFDIAMDFDQRLGGGSGAGPNIVPEPSTLVLAAIAAAAFWAYRRRRRA